MSKARQLADLGNVYDDGALSNRNKVINGGMQCFQRSTAATTMTNSYGAVDRFRGFSNGGGAFTGEQYDMTTSEIATTGQYQALKMLVSTADTSIAASEYYSLNYRFEGDDLQQLKYGSSSAQSFTVSFWVKSDTTGTYFLTVDKLANGQTAYRIPIEYTISSADTWEQKIITVSPTAGSTSLITSSAGAIGGGTGHGLSLYWGFAWGTDYHGTNNTWSTSYGTNATANNWMGTVGNDFYLTGVQLEIGDTSTPFEHRSYGDELARCQRYYQIWGAKGKDYHAKPMWIYNSTQAATTIDLPQEMRATPSFSVVGNVQNSSGGSVGVSAWALYYAGAWVGCSALEAGTASPTSFRLDADAFNSITSGGACGLYGGTDCYITLDSEL